VADWGVGEELFDGMPGRRFDRRPHRPIPRGDAADGRRTIVIEGGEDQLPPQEPERVEEEFATREEALRARRLDDELWAGDEPFADPEPAPDPDPAPELAAADLAPLGDELPTAEHDVERGEARKTAAVARGEGRATAAVARGAGRATAAVASGEGRETAAVVRGSQTGRRTVKIGGRPAEFHGPPARARQRPPRSVHERLGPRPERIAAWAFALGILLILIAIATANG
jgi:hypothetical protein